MKRQVIAAVLALAFVCCSAMALFTTVSMDRAWGESAACSIDSLTRGELLQLTALYPDLRWTAYAQSAPEQIGCDTFPGRTSKAAVLTFLGDPNRIAFFPVISGRLPLDGESGACAIDADTAFQLFGSVDPGETTVRLGGERVRIVGVMDVQSPLMLIPATRSRAEAAGEEEAGEETFGRLAADNRDALLTLENALRVDPDPYELSGAELARLARLMCAVPWGVALAFGLAALYRRGGAARIIGAALICALSLGALLAVLMSIPVRLLPSRWSDLEFYGKQLTALKARPFRAGDVRDGLLQWDMLTACLFSAAAFIALWLERMCLRCGKSH